MPVMTWNDKLSVGITAIDAQHRQLLEICNELHDALKAGRGPAALGTIFDRLTVYTKMHFRDEEGLLERHDYPTLSGHRKFHAEIIARLDQLQRDHQSGKVDVSVRTLDFMREWIVKHIQGIDAQYATFLRSKGLQ